MFIKRHAKIVMYYKKEALNLKVQIKFHKSGIILKRNSTLTNHANYYDHQLSYI